MNKIIKNKDSWFGKIADIFFLMLVFCLPFGTRLQWINDWSYLGGELSDFTMYFVYLTDILLVLLLVFWLFDLMIKFWKYGDWDDWRLNPWQGLVVVFFFLLMLWAYYSTLWAVVKPIAWYDWLRLFGIFGFTSYLVLRVGKRFGSLVQTLAVFVVSVLMQSIWGIAQYIVQHDFGGWWLGESILGNDILGVAKLDLAGEKIVRAYGSLPHANVYSFYMLAGFIVLLLVIFYWEIISDQVGRLKIRKYSAWLVGLMLGLISVGCLVGFSRSVWVAGAIVGVGFVVQILISWRDKNNGDLKKGVKNFVFDWKFLVSYLVVLAAGIYWNWRDVFSRLSFEASSDVSLNTRVFLDLAADWIINKVYYQGVGIGNFVLVLPYYGGELMSWWLYQPVHNTFKLVMAELGVIGMVIFVLLWLFVFCSVLFSNAKNYPKVFWLAVVIALVWLQFFDHYMWDIWQGRLLMGMLVGLVVVFSGLNLDKMRVKK